ncbi:MAG: antirestriction protein ArdA [Mycobacteriaceae bacterium]
MPSIYVASLSDYNAGRLHGHWIDCDGLDAEDIAYDIDRMLALSPEAQRCQWCGEGAYVVESGPFKGWAVHTETSCGRVPYLAPSEEWAIHDHEGWEGLPIGEYTSPERLEHWARMLDRDGAAYGAYVSWSGDEDADESEFDEAYCGEWDSMAEYAENLADELGLLDSDQHWPNSCVDWGRAARELEMDGYYTAEAPGFGVYVFRSY